MNEVIPQKEEENNNKEKKKQQNKEVNWMLGIKELFVGKNCFKNFNCLFNFIVLIQTKYGVFFVIQSMTIWMKKNSFQHY